MKRHYLKIPASVATWMPDGAEGDWRGRILADIEGDGRLVVERMPPNDLGDRAAIHGDEYYIEIGRDRDPSRRDTLFLMRVAAQRLPRRAPVKLVCGIVAWPGGAAATLDPVDHLFASELPGQLNGGSGRSDAEERPEISPLLKRLLREAPGELRVHVRPGTDVEESGEPAAFLAPFRQLWSRLRLDRYLRLSPRDDALIRGRVKPQSLSGAQRSALRKAFGIELLHRIAVDDDSRVIGVARAIAAIPIRAGDRAAIWVATLESLSGVELRRELHECAEALSELVAVGGARGRAWRSVIADGFAGLAGTGGEELRDAVGDRAEPTDVLEAVSAWARDLAFAGNGAEGTSKSADERGGGPRVAPAVTSSATAARADEWILGLRVPDRGPLERLHDALSEAAAALPTPGAVASVAEVAAFHGLVEGVERRLREWREALGDVSELRRDLEEGRVALRRLEEAGGAAACSVVGEGVTPRDATEIAELLEGPALDHAPGWLLGDGAQEPPAVFPTSKAEWAAVLVDTERRNLLRLFCDLASELNEQRALAWIATPEPDADLENHLREWFRRVREFLREVPADLRALVEHESADLRLAQEHATRLRQLKTELRADIWANIDEHLRRSVPKARPALLSAYERAVVFCREHFGSLEELTFPLLRARVEKETSPLEDGEESAVAMGRVTVEHNYLEGRTARATLMFAAAESGEDYGFVSVPLVLETDQPRTLQVRLEWRFSGDTRAAWSRDWPGPEPGDDDPVAVPIYAWRRQPDVTKWHFPVVARLPIRTPKAANPHVAVGITVVEARTGKALGNTRSLRWDSITRTSHTIGVTWGDATEPSHVREHPIGPQCRADAIRDRFVAGSSVAVIAPRRFGKSTLVEYLVNEGRRHKLLIPPAVVCTKYASASGFDYERMWGDVSEALVDKSGARLKRDSASALPAAEAFDAVRRAAKSKGYRAVVLLFDEAQLFFPGQDGVALGSALKTLLERRLARRGDSKRVPLLFGLIGLPSLRSRAGSDLMGLLNPIEETRMDESELRPLVAKMTSGLQTTRGARERLASTAGNLLILRALLEKLAVRATRDRRVWVNFDDVSAVEEELKQDLQNGLEQTVASYVRDVLNAADRVDDWRPIPSLPVAAAWARTSTPNLAEEELKSRALGMLNEWCRLSQGDEQHGIRMVYTGEVLEHHLQQLRERRVLDGSEFVSALLRAWLASTADRGALDPTFREALFTGAQRRIGLPEGASPVAEGAQATIWRYEQYAYRVRQLGDEHDRQRFFESSDMLEALRQIVRRREAGSDHVFDLVDMGLSAQDEREAVQVYRWVQGKSLAGREGTLAADIVIELGAKLARGVRLLHRNNILHRDIHPRNIVLDDASDPVALRPVLIDFGFARIETRTMHTVMSGDHVAPEVQRGRPEWTRAADVYSLGSTLLSLVAKEEKSADLRGVLDEAMSTKPEGRPTAEELLERLEELEVGHRVEERRSDVWREMRRLVARHQHEPWFGRQMNKMRESLVAVALGFYRAPGQRYGVIADFLNQVAEGNPQLESSLWGLGMRTGGARGEDLRTLGALRNYHVHGGGKQNDEQTGLVRTFLALPEAKMRAQVERGGRAAAELAGLDALPSLVQRLLGAEGRGAQG